MGHVDEPSADEDRRRHAARLGHVAALQHAERPRRVHARAHTHLHTHTRTRARAHALGVHTYTHTHSAHRIAPQVVQRLVHGPLELPDRAPPVPAHAAVRSCNRHCVCLGRKTAPLRAVPRQPRPIALQRCAMVSGVCAGTITPRSSRWWSASARSTASSTRRSPCSARSVHPTRTHARAHAHAHTHARKSRYGPARAARRGVVGGDDAARRLSPPLPSE